MRNFQVVFSFPNPKPTEAPAEIRVNVGAEWSGKAQDMAIARVKENGVNVLPDNITGIYDAYGRNYIR